MSVKRGLQLKPLLMNRIHGMSSLKEIADQYQASTDYFQSLLSGVTPETVDIKYPGEWSARQVIHHMADSEAQSYARLRRLIAEPEGSIIQGYDESAWANNSVLGYNELAIEIPLAVLFAVRAASHSMLLRISESDLARFGVHTEAGDYTLGRWVETYTRHPRDHGSQLERALRGEK
jgi:DNA-binding PucR family transcriptional regulator